jgi:hypothetical protein
VVELSGVFMMDILVRWLTAGCGGGWVVVWIDACIDRDGL